MNELRYIIPMARFLYKKTKTRTTAIPELVAMVYPRMAVIYYSYRIPLVFACIKANPPKLIVHPNADFLNTRYKNRAAHVTAIFRDLDEEAERLKLLFNIVPLTNKYLLQEIKDSFEELGLGCTEKQKLNVVSSTVKKRSIII